MNQNEKSPTLANSSQTQQMASAAAASSTAVTTATTSSNDQTQNQHLFHTYYQVNLCLIITIFIDVFCKKVLFTII